MPRNVDASRARRDHSGPERSTGISAAGLANGFVEGQVARKVYERGEMEGRKSTTRQAFKDSVVTDNSAPVTGLGRGREAVASAA